MAKLLLVVAFGVSLLTCLGEQGFGQSPPTQPVAASVAENPKPSQLEAAGYKVVGVTVDDPFSFLPFIEKRCETLVTNLNALLLNKPYSFELARTQAFKVISQSGLTPSGQDNLDLLIESASIVAIDSQAKTLRLRYRILSIAPPYSLGGAIESQQTTTTSPQTAAGVSQLLPNPSLLPQLAYNPASGFLAGGALSFKPTGNFSKFISNVSISGQGSGNTRDLDVALAGSHHSQGFLSDTNWRLDYTNQAAPVSSSAIEGAALSVQLDTQTRPFWNASGFFRTGFLIQGGNEQAQLSGVVLPANTIANSGEGSIRLYEGLSQSSAHNALTLSYGLELGSATPLSGIDWRRHIGEASSNFWWNLGDHRPLEVESRLDVGALQVPSQVPLTTRFFGGNAEHYFIPNDTWQIHDQPYIRAIPANQFATTANGVGGESFTAVNVTLSYPLFVRPLVPTDVISDPQVQHAISGALVSAQSIEENYYQYKDPEFAASAALLPAVKTDLTQLQSDVNNLRSSSTNSSLDFEDCSEAIDGAITLVDNALSATDMTQYGRVTSLTNLMPNDDDDLGVIQQYCGDGLNASLNNPKFTSDLAAVADQRTALLADLKKIDNAAAQKKAAADLSLAHRTLNTLFTEVNIISVAPVAIFDIAHLGPAASNGTRLGPGAGIRLELASYVDFTLGYGRNLHRQIGESSGAIFFSMTFRDLFR